MTTYKIFKMTATGERYAKAAKTLKDPEGVYTEAVALIATLPGDPKSYAIFELTDAGELVPFEAPKPKTVKTPKAPKVIDLVNCANGHAKAEWWTTTAGGRKYCRKCAVAASIKSKTAKKLAAKTE